MAFRPLWASEGRPSAIFITFWFGGIPACSLPSVRIIPLDVVKRSRASLSSVVEGQGESVAAWPQISGSLSTSIAA